MRYLDKRGYIEKSAEKKKTEKEKLIDRAIFPSEKSAAALGTVIIPG